MHCLKSIRIKLVFSSKITFGKESNPSYRFSVYDEINIADEENILFLEEIDSMIEAAATCEWLTTFNYGNSSFKQLSGMILQY